MSSGLEVNPIFCFEHNVFLHFTVFNIIVTAMHLDFSVRNHFLLLITPLCYDIIFLEDPDKNKGLTQTHGGRGFELAAKFSPRMPECASICYVNVVCL